MKREFLKGLDLGNGAVLPDKAVEAIMAEYGKSESKLKASIQSLTTERDGLQAQLSEASTTIQGYKDLDIEGIKQSAANWETKYNTDTQALQEQLETTRKTYAAEQSVSGMKFTSEAAKRAYISDLLAKNLPLQDGKFLGQEAFTAEYKKTDPGVFAPETAPPTFTLGGKSQPQTGGSSAMRAAFGLPD